MTSFTTEMVGQGVVADSWKVSETMDFLLLKTMEFVLKVIQFILKTMLHGR